MQRPRPLSLLVLAVAAVVAAAAACVLLLRPSASERDLVGSFEKAGVASTRSALAFDVAPAASRPGPDAFQADFARRKLIRSGTLSIEVGRYAEAAERAVAVAAAHGGYLAEARATREPGDRRRGTLTLRVDARSFDASFAGLKALGEVQSATVETQDASRAYADLELRLSVKREAQARLREILRTRTGKLSELLEAEGELSRLVEEAERLEGERRFFDRQVALSTITLELSEPAAFFQDGGAAPLAKALREALPLLARSAAAMLYAAALTLPWALMALVVWKIRSRNRVRRLIRIAEVEG